MPNGFGRGFGFRGSSPPWPYVGRGRGGLPRCGYFFAGSAAPPAWLYPPTPQPYYGPKYASAYTSFNTPMSKEEELGFLKQQAEAMRVELKEIEGRIQELAK